MEGSVVRIKPAGPGESEASVLHLALTTITRPMIEENTISLAANRAPSLAEAGFDQEERKKLERLGVSNTSQLRRLGNSTGTSVMSRLTEIPVDRLRTAFAFGRKTICSATFFPSTTFMPRPRLALM